MKLNKAFVKVGGVTIIDRILLQFTSTFDETLIISNEPELYKDYGVSVHTDIYPRQGPVSGIHAGLFYAKKPLVYVQSCDLPFMIPSIADILCTKIEDYDCAIPVINGLMQPMSGLYHKALMPVFEKFLINDKLKLTRLIEEALNARWVCEDELSALGDIELRFLNVNDEEALKKAEQQARGL